MEKVRADIEDLLVDIEKVRPNIEDLNANTAEVRALSLCLK